ncbi:MAG: hypothetical protein ACK559_00475, partial [bacterium]
MSCLHHRQLLYHHTPNVIHMHLLVSQRCLQWRVPDYHGWIPLVEQEVVSYDLLQPREDLYQRAGWVPYIASLHYINTPKLALLQW